MINIDQRIIDMTQFYKKSVEIIYMEKWDMHEININSQKRYLHKSLLCSVKTIIYIVIHVLSIK